MVAGARADQGEAGWFVTVVEVEVGEVVDVVDVVEVVVLVDVVVEDDVVGGEEVLVPGRVVVVEAGGICHGGTGGGLGAGTAGVPAWAAGVACGETEALDVSGAGPGSASLTTGAWPSSAAIIAGSAPSMPSAQIPSPRIENELASDALRASEVGSSNQV